MEKLVNFNQPKPEANSARGNFVSAHRPLDKVSHMFLNMYSVYCR